MADGELAPERRVDDLGREAFQLAVTSATRAATQEVARVHRVRLVTQAGIIAFLVALAIAGGVAWLLLNGQGQQDKQNALHNCHLVAALSAPLADFVASDAHLRLEQARLSGGGVGRAFSRLFGKSLYARALAQSNALNAQVTEHWLRSVVPRLQHVASDDCAGAIK